MIARTLVLTGGILIMGGCNQGNKQSQNPTPTHRTDVATPASGAPAKSDSTKQAVYTCPMDPEVVSDQPGKCPKCGMNLVRKDAAGGGGSGQTSHMHNH